MKFRNLMVLIIMIFGICVLAVAKEEPKVEWKYIKGGQGTGIVRGGLFDEVWSTAMDVLMFEKFKPRGCAFKIIHEPIEIEKDTGLISLHGIMGGTRRYALRVIIQKKDDHIALKLRCTSAWKKRVIEKFFQLLEQGFKQETKNSSS